MAYCVYGPTLTQVHGAQLDRTCSLRCMQRLSIAPHRATICTWPMSVTRDSATVSYFNLPVPLGTFTTVSFRREAIVEFSGHLVMCRWFVPPFYIQRRTNATLPAYTVVSCMYLAEGQLPSLIKCYKHIPKKQRWQLLLFTTHQYKHVGFIIDNCPVHSPWLKTHCLVYTPPLINMLKFRGYPKTDSWHNRGTGELAHDTVSIAENYDVKISDRFKLRIDWSHVHNMSYSWRPILAMMTLCSFQ